MRRGRIFYFRKRLPRAESNRHSNLFLCLSLRTDLPFDAVKRAAALLTVYEQEEETIVTAIEQATLTPAHAKALMTEILRAELARILKDQVQTALQSDRELDQRIEDLEAENRALRRAARHGNWDNVQKLLDAASDRVGISMPDALSADVKRQAASLKRRLNDVEKEVLDGDDVRYCARPLLDDHQLEDFESFVVAPVLLSACWDKALELYPSKDMKGNIGALSRLAIEFFGDVPITSLTKERQKAFFAWMERLPKNHGKRHGKNRFSNKGTVLTKAFEISEADAEDMRITEELRGRSDLSIPEKRAMLAEKLVPRLTMTTIRRNRDGLNRLFKAARELGGTVDTALSYAEIERHLKAVAPEDKLYVRVTKPKTRRPWSSERLGQFFMSPIYTGCASEHRRWKRGRKIIRDATYWVPLIVLSLGSRIEEILLLKRKDVIFRNDHYCLALNHGPEQTGKNMSSKRILPIPDLLLNLGFVEWFQALPDSHGILLFPEIAKRSATGDVTSAFGKHFQRILHRLNLGDFDEDFYAARMTFSSMLNAANIAEGQRQAIAGHSNGSVLNCHYTAHHVGDLKAAMDKADFQLRIEYRREYGFPVIRDCSLAKVTGYRIEATLNDHEEAETILLFDNKSSTPLFHFSSTEITSQDALWREAGRLRSLITGHVVEFPKNDTKQRAVEHFLAMARGVRQS